MMQYGDLDLDKIYKKQTRVIKKSNNTKYKVNKATVDIILKARKPFKTNCGFYMVRNSKTNSVFIEYSVIPDDYSYVLNKYRRKKHLNFDMFKKNVLNGTLQYSVLEYFPDGYNPTRKEIKKRKNELIEIYKSRMPGGNGYSFNTLLNKKIRIFQSLKSKSKEIEVYNTLTSELEYGDLSIEELDKKFTEKLDEINMKDKSKKNIKDTKDVISNYLTKEQRIKRAYLNNFKTLDCAFDFLKQTDMLNYVYAYRTNALYVDELTKELKSLEDKKNSPRFKNLSMDEKKETRRLIHEKRIALNKQNREQGKKTEREVSIIKNALVFGYIEEIKTLYPSNYIVFWHTSVSSNFTAMIKCDRLQYDNIRYNLENPEELKKFIIALNGFKSILKAIKKQTKEIRLEIEEQILEDFLSF
jgi:hypothetical protein